jgi:sulfide:quinone oxidoreductase
MTPPAQAPSATRWHHSTVQPLRVLVVGGGIAGVEALMALADLGESRLKLRVVAAHSSFVLRPQILGEPWGGAPLHIDLARLCRAFGADFSAGNVTDVDAAAHRVRLADGTTLEYDRLLLAPGARPALPFTGARVLGFGPLPHDLAGTGGGSVAVVVPPGTSWTLPAYELALLTAANTRREVRVVTAEAAPLEAFGPDPQPAIRALLARAGVTVETSRTPALGADLGELADTVIALPLLEGPAFGGVPADRHGFVAVDATMAVAGTEHVHAAGDATDHAIKQGGLAGQQADTAAAEIVRSCGATSPPIAYEPVLRGKLMAPGGDELYLRRALDGSDAGRAAPDPLWKPPGVVCAWRLARWPSYRRDELDAYTLDHVARPQLVGAGVPGRPGARTSIGEERYSRR